MIEALTWLSDHLHRIFLLLILVAVWVLRVIDAKD